MDGSRNTRSVLDQRLAIELDRIRTANLYRVRRVVAGTHGAQITVDGKSCVNFCSNDYLGLAADPRLAEAARKSLSISGTGSGAAALVSGYNAEHARLEEELAQFVQRPRALLFGSGWAANLGVLRALLGKNDTLIADELNHASLIDGGRLSGARYLRVAHGDASAFARAFSPLKKGGDGGFALLATDSVFSMGGDLAPLPALSALCHQHAAALMVDDAHGFGVLGDCGRGSLFLAPPFEKGGAGGISTRASLSVSDVPIYVATLGKALGCAGAFVAGSEALIEYLIQRARSWVFSTAPPPAIAAAARAALRVVREDSERRVRLFDNLRRFRIGAAQVGIALGESQTPIQPLILGDEQRALALSQYLFARGLWVAAIRPPTVPPGTARLRITLSAAHTAAQIDRLLDALAAGLKEAAC